MGNYISSTCKMTSTGGSGGLLKNLSTKTAATVLFPTGEVRAVEPTTKAAEVMMEAPNYLVVDAATLKIGARLSPLPADHDLEVSTVYVMLPMYRKNSVVAASDIASLFLTADSVVKRHRHSRRAAVGGGGGKVRDLPEGSAPRLLLATRSFGGSDDETMSDDAAAAFQFMTMHRLSMSRSRKPSLDTIVEEPARHSIR
ncbi:hypothetical protein LINGRAHAP2_LOCUS18613 [Linum grandiflorum]